MKIWMICLWIYSRNLEVLTPFKRTIYEVEFEQFLGGEVRGWREKEKITKIQYKQLDHDSEFNR